MITSGSLPVITLKGPPREMGRKHGRLAKDKIDRNLEVYFRRFKNETELTQEEALERASKYLSEIRKRDRVYADTMEGVSEGSGRDLLEITALNVRYELMYSQFSKIGLKPIPRTFGCTAFAALPEVVRNGHLLMGQNWDWIPEVKGLFLKVRNTHGPDVLSFTEAGVVGGKIGLNSNGIGLLINGLVSDRDDWSRLGEPFHVRCWRVLNSRNLAAAKRAVNEGRRSCSANFLIGQETRSGGKLVNIESAPEATCNLGPLNGAVGHTNHFTEPERVGVKQILGEERMSTLQRYSRIQQLLDEKVRSRQSFTVSAAKDMLQDHHGRPESVCRHPNADFVEDERYKTVVSVVMDLHSRKLWASLGSPCETPYGSLQL